MKKRSKAKIVLSPFLGGEKMTIQKCISISREFEDLAKEHRISWSEAARVGMSVMLAELEIQPYDNKLNIVRKVDKLVKRLGEVTEKLE